MSRKRGTRRLCTLPLALLFVLALPPIARAETHTFLGLPPDGIYPTAGAGTEGAANSYPSSIVVSGLAGTVTKATVTLIRYASSRPDDTDMAITGPNGQSVMLTSDACGTTAVARNNWIFDDSAPTFISNNGPCASNQNASFLPSNYLGNAEPDSLTPGGGPPPPYVNALSFFAGAPPSGTWSLYAFDDEAGFVGFDFAGWALTLEVQPPPPQATPQLTGQRAEALKKCKKKHGKARRKCKRKANRLPV